MPSRDAGLVVLWPHYFDAKRSRKAGRRVPSDMAVEKPDAKWVESAARKAGLNPELLEDARHPSAPHKVVGCVTVPKAGSKEALLKQVASQLSGQKP